MRYATMERVCCAVSMYEQFTVHASDRSSSRSPSTVTVQTTMCYERMRVFYLNGANKIGTPSEVAEATDRPTDRPTDRDQPTHASSNARKVTSVTITLLREFLATAIRSLVGRCIFSISSTAIRTEHRVSPLPRNGACVCARAPFASVN